MNIFAYGTLMDKANVEEMLGHSVEMIPMSLPDYIKLKPNFYMIFPKKGHEVYGLLIPDLSDEDIKRFDAYEGNGYGYYDRQPVKVYSIFGVEYAAEAYVGGDKMTWFFEASES